MIKNSQQLKTQKNAKSRNKNHENQFKNMTKICKLKSYQKLFKKTKKQLIN